MAEGLRERKKRQTHGRIASAALELFAERGFEGATIADIAERAEISPRTFFAYFPTKEDVVFADHADDVASLRGRLAQREPGESAIEAVRAWIPEAMADRDEALEALRHRLIAENESVAARNRALTGDFERVLADAVVADLGFDAGDVRTQVVARATAGALGALKDHFDETGTPHDPADLAPVEDALRFLEAGVEALRRR